MVMRKRRGIDYEALLTDILAFEQEDSPPKHYALMQSTLDGMYVVKYLRSHSPSRDVAKQVIERTILAKMRSHKSLNVVCQSLAPNSVIASIAKFVRARIEGANAADVLRNFQARLTVSLNFKKSGFVELRGIAQNACASIWTGIVIHRLVADALQKLHLAGVYHGDIHFGNILYRIASDGCADIRIIDFDLSSFMSRANRLVPLGNRTVVKQRENYNIEYSYSNFMFTNTTRLLATTAQQIHVAEAKLFQKVAELRGIVSPGSKKMAFESFIGFNMREWIDCTAWWPTSVRGVSTFCKYDEHLAMTRVLRVVVDARPHDSDLFAHEICMARTLNARVVQAVDLNLMNVPNLYQLMFRHYFKLVKGVPFECAHGCLLALLIRGQVAQSLPSSSHAIVIGNVRMMVDTARVMPSADHFASAASYAQYQKTQGDFIRSRYAR